MNTKFGIQPTQKHSAPLVRLLIKLPSPIKQYSSIYFPARHQRHRYTLTLDSSNFALDARVPSLSYYRSSPFNPGHARTPLYEAIRLPYKLRSGGSGRASADMRVHEGTRASPLNGFITCSHARARHVAPSPISLFNGLPLAGEEIISLRLCGAFARRVTQQQRRRLSTLPLKVHRFFRRWLPRWDYCCCRWPIDDPWISDEANVNVCLYINNAHWDLSWVSWEDFRLIFWKF